MNTLPNVTEHALLRYLERVCGIDINAVRRTIENDVRAAVGMGATRLSRDGFTYVIKGQNVVSVVADHSPSAARRNGVQANGNNARFVRPIRERAP